MPTLAEIDAELTRRGIPIPEAPQKTQLELIDAELARRGIEVPRETGVIEGMADNISDRAEKFGGDIFNLQKDIGNVLEDPMGAVTAASRIPTRMAGVMAGTAGDVIGAGVEGAMGLVPDAIKDPIKEGAKSLMETSFGKNVVEAIQGGVETYGAFKKENPELAQDVEDVFNVASMIPAVKAAKVGAEVAPGAVKGVIGAGKEIASLKSQSPAKQRIAELIKANDITQETVGFDIRPKTRLERFLKIDTDKVVKNKVDTEAIRQGFDKAFVADIKGATSQTKMIGKKMVEVMRKVRTRSAAYGIKNRPSNFLGDSLLKRYNVVKRANKKAGSLIDRVARGLKSKPFNSGNIEEKYIKNLNKMGIKISLDDAGELAYDFKGSDIMGLDDLETIVKKVTERMRSTGMPDPYEAHKIKRYLDEVIPYGKIGSGLSGKTERVLKDLRRDINEEIGKLSPRYKKVNKSYSETVGAMKALQDVAGRKTDLSGDRTNSELGTLLRGVMSNNKSRDRLIGAIDEIEGISKKYGADFKDDLLVQILLVDELDKVFKPIARTSAQGILTKAAESTISAAVNPAAAAVKGAIKGAESAVGINEKGAFKAIQKLLMD